MRCLRLISRWKILTATIYYTLGFQRKHTESGVPLVQKSKKDEELQLRSMDRSFGNVLLLGASFFLIFTAFQTGGMIQKPVIEGINIEYPTMKWDAYISFCIIYAVLGIANWIAPSTVAFIGPKYSMILGAATYCLFVANFLHPTRYGLYVASFVIGLGAAIIWTGQGNFLTLCSTQETMARNSGIFWAMLQCSFLFGNLFVYFQFQDEKIITEDTRKSTYIALTSVCVLGTLLLGALRPTNESTSLDAPMGPLEAFQRSFRLLKTKQMLLLCITFVYTGLELAFFSALYSAAIGATLTISDDPKKYIGISGMLIGAGEIIGGATFGIFGSKTVKWGRDVVILFGFLVHMAAFFLIFLNIPSAASLKDTTSSAYIPSSLPLALLCSFLLGLGDSCFNTQIYSFLGTVYSEESAPAFAMFKLFQSIAAAVAFVYANLFGLHPQIYILTVSAALGTLSFCVVEWNVYLKSKKEQSKSEERKAS